jgi:hypothetical protein
MKLLIPAYRRQAGTDRGRSAALTALSMPKGFRVG